MTTRLEGDVLINTHKKREPATPLKKTVSDSSAMNSASCLGFLGGDAPLPRFLNS